MLRPSSLPAIADRTPAPRGALTGVKSDWVIRNGRVLRPEGLQRDDLVIAGGTLAETAGDAHFGRFDAEGLLVLPGIVDIHGDAFERQIMPRPGVTFPLELALQDTDRQLLSSGITTAFHGITWSWEPGLRGTQGACAIIDAVFRMSDRLCVDTRIHLRHEVFNLAAEDQILALIAQGGLGCLAFNDHMEGTLKSRSRPDKAAKMIERTGLDAAAFSALVEATYARRAEVPASIRRLAEAGVAAGLPMLSHDDPTPETRDEYRSLGVAVAEFPVTEAVALASAQAGDPIVFGAPNVVRGGSHTGCPSAEEMVARRQCDVLASDYYYPALPLAPFILEAKGVATFEQAYRLVSEGPAKALGLHDRGVLATGLRADVIAVRPPSTGIELAVIAAFTAGNLVHLAEAWRVN